MPKKKRAKTNRKRNSKASRSVEIVLPRPFPLQTAILNHPAKRKVICAGRRGGKTVLAGIAGTQGLLAGKRVLLSSTSQDQSDVFWEYIVEWLTPLIGTRGFYKNEVKRIIRFNGGQVRVKTGRNPDVLRGGKADLLVLDECAYLDPTAWGQVGAPMLADTEGDAIFISTPKRRNWFFELYHKALADDSGLWAAWTYPTYSNPHLTARAIEILKSDMTSEDLKQEIEAEFLEGQGAVFREIDAVCTSIKMPPYAGEFIAGVDWGKSGDYTVITVFDKNTRRMVDYDRFNGEGWALQRGRLKAMIDKWKVFRVIAEENSFGAPNIEALQDDGLPIESFNTNPSTKPPLIESLVLAFDREEISLIDDNLIKGEFMAYERKVSSTGRSQYSAPEGLHDDIVMSTALAWYGIINMGVIFA